MRRAGGWSIGTIGAAALAAGILAGLALPGLAQTGAVHKVGMLGSLYGPDRIEARRGDSLVFDNDDGDDHIVFVPTDGYGINFGTTKPGQSVTLALRKAGTFRVECVFHPDMVMAVTVQR